MEIRAIDFVTYAVTDLDRALTFYRNTLGLKVDETFGDQYVEFDIGGQTLAIMAGHGRPGPGGGTVGLNVPNLARSLAELKAQGIEPVMDVIETPVCRMALIQDPDGNLLMLHEKPKAG